MIRYCEDCGDQINKQRVIFNPDVSRCVECQADAESMGVAKRHTMKHHIRFRGEEIESMESEIVRAL
jgi:RNA polymerase-binding transcription factor DksA